MKESQMGSQEDLYITESSKTVYIPHNSRPPAEEDDENNLVLYRRFDAFLCYLNNGAKVCGGAGVRI